MTVSRSTPVTVLKGVGAAVAEKLSKLGITTLEDLLFHLPLRYEDRTAITPIGGAQIGQRCVVEGDIVASDITFGRRRSLLIAIQDGTGTLRLRFFHFSRAQQQQLTNGKRLRCFGDIRRGGNAVEMVHPEYQFVSDDLALDDTLTPVYPVTEGLNQARLRRFIGQAMQQMNQGRLLPELLDSPQDLSISDAIRIIHEPRPEDDIDALLAGEHPAQKRLAFEELLAQRLGLRLVREQARQLSAVKLQAHGHLTEPFITALPFQLTAAQQRVCQEVTDDMQHGWPMLRLLQGDVGSGKTIVAAYAALLAAENDFQAAVMAPTEILAEQHFLNFHNWLSELGVQCAWLSGRVKGRQRQEQLALIESGTAQVVIGTHALFQEDVQFNQLGLVIIDEQHRFGVHQRLALREKGADDARQPHQLVMTATPIPRTLTMSLYADMDSSILDELPPGRLPVTTTVIAENRRDDVVARVRAACLEGRQAYWVCTLIEESEVLQCQAAEATAAMLTEALPDITVGLIHGRMSAAEKTQLMDQFKSGMIQLLVATTVIEVGVDVPNASLMIIENPERLGLAQLHQLRGRVGRGTDASHCVLLYSNPLSETSRRRLNVMRESQDGFRIAEEDLKIRGPGEVLGSRQAGDIQFKIADFVRDAHLLPEISSASEKLLAGSPETVQALIRRWASNAEDISQV